MTVTTNPKVGPTPWWEVMTLRQEIVNASGSIDDVQMSLYNALYGSAKDGIKPPYSDAVYYGEITYPGDNLVALLGQIAVRLGGGTRYTSAAALHRLSQGMGGGKSHGLIGLWHLAAHPVELAKTEVGQKALQHAADLIGQPLPGDLNSPHVVVLACDNMTAGVGNPLLDGPAVTLHERFLWRLFGGNMPLYNQYRPHHGDKSQIAAAIAAVNRPVLILVDEIMDYVRQLSDSSVTDVAIKDMACLRALFDVINDVPNAAMVVVMISTDKDSIDLDEAGQRRRADLDALLDRNGKPATVTSNTDFADILRRRLFIAPPSASLAQDTSTYFQSAMTGTWAKSVFNNGATANAAEFAEEVSRCYPFHPSLIHLAEKEWSLVTGFQRVRSTIRIFAATAFTLLKRTQLTPPGWAPLLIGTGDLPLSDRTVREALLGSGLIADERARTNYRQLAAADIVSDDDKSGHARELDIPRTGDLKAMNPRAAERAATALFLYSIMGPRSQGRQGATEAEAKAATFVPGGTFGIGEAESILAELSDPEHGLAALEHVSGVGGQPARLYLSTRQTLQMLYRANRATVKDRERDEEFAKAAEALSNSGPFKEKRFISVTKEDEDKTPFEILSTAGLDDARRTRLVILDPSVFSLLNGADKETRRALRAGLGIGPEKMAVQWASSCVFAVVNTQRRNNTKVAVSEYVAWGRVCGLDAVKEDAAFFAEAQGKRKDAKTRMDKLVRAAFQHIVYMDEEEGTRVDKVIRLEGDNESALDGTVVWAKLAEAGKVLGSGEFTAKALLANLQDSDYDRPLDEVRDLFWGSPRMPLLFGGESDLQQAIFAAMKASSVRLVGADGADRICTVATELNLSASSLRLAKPAPSAELQTGAGATYTPPTGGGSSVHEGNTTTGTGAVVSPSNAKSIQVGMTLNLSLPDAEARQHVWKLLDQIATDVDTQATHVQASIKVVLPEATAQALEQLAKKLGISTTKTEMP